ncbi:hypothetical protein QG37_01216 [Candidozyma auris]|nr:hypothetical protein QG37_01216 [[Candida] auris]
MSAVRRLSFLFFREPRFRIPRGEASKKKRAGKKKKKKRPKWWLPQCDHKENMAEKGSNWMLSTAYCLGVRTGSSAHAALFGPFLPD